MGGGVGQKKKVFPANPFRLWDGSVVGCKDFQKGQGGYEVWFGSADKEIMEWEWTDVDFKKKWQMRS